MPHVVAPDFDFKVNDWVLCVDSEDCDGLLCDGAVYKVVDVSANNIVFGHTAMSWDKERFLPWLTAAKIAADGKEYDGFSSDAVDETARRKAQPVCTGVLDYFPDALLAVAQLSKLGNDKYNPGQPMHHARGKSMDHADALLRHHMARGTLDPDTGLSHSVGVAWRALAQLQEELEAAGAPLARGAKR